MMTAEGGKHGSHRPRVIMILGSQRGGTTLVGSLLAGLSGFLYIGEALQLFRRGETHLVCGCGLPRKECPIWSQVFGADFPERAAIRQFARWGYTEPTQSSVRNMYLRIHEAGGDSAIVDTSKDPRYGAFVASIPELDVELIHIVRDVPGVVASVLRRRPALPRLPRFLLLTRIALHWNKRHAECDLSRLRFSGTLARYEDIVHAPVDFVEGVMGSRIGSNRNARWDVPVIHGPIADGAFAKPHEMELREDLRWQEELGARELRVAKLLGRRRTRYGYA